MHCSVAAYSAVMLCSALAGGAPHKCDFNKEVLKLVGHISYNINTIVDNTL